MNPKKKNILERTAALSLLAFILLLCGCGGGAKKSALEKGIELLKSGDYEAAAKSLKKASEQNPDDATIAYNLGTAFWKLGDHRQAARAFSLAKEKDPADPWAPEFLGYVYLSESDWPAAQLEFERAAEMAGNSAPLFTALALAERGSSEPELAKEHLEQAITWDPTYSPALFNLACIYRDELAQPTQAQNYLKRFLQVVEEGPQKDKARAEYHRIEKELSGHTGGNSVNERSSTEQLINQARMALGRGDEAAAVAFVRQAITEDPDNPDPLWELANIYDQANKSQEAERIRARFRSQFPTDRRAAHIEGTGANGNTGNTGNGNTGTGNTGNTSNNGGNSTEDQGVDIREEYAKARRLLQASKFSEAAAILEKVIAAEPGNIEAVVQLGIAYKGAGKTTNAKNTLERAVRLKPRDPKLHYALAEILYDLRKYDDAKKRINALLKISPDYARAYWLTSRIHQAQGNNSLAQRYMKLYREMGGQ